MGKKKVGFSNINKSENHIGENYILIKNSFEDDNSDYG